MLSRDFRSIFKDGWSLLLLPKSPVTKLVNFPPCSSINDGIWSKMGILGMMVLKMDGLGVCVGFSINGRLDEITFPFGLNFNLNGFLVVVVLPMVVINGLTKSCSVGRMVE